MLDPWVLVDENDFTEHVIDIEEIVDTRAYANLSIEKFEFILENHSQEVLSSLATDETLIQHCNMVDQYGMGLLQYVGPHYHKLCILKEHFPEIDFNNGIPKVIDLAVSTGQNESIAFLINNGATYNHTDEEGNNLLHLAVKDHLPKYESRDLGKTMGYLMSLGVSLYDKNKNGESALDLLESKDKALHDILNIN